MKRSRLGQNFLFDPSIARRIVDSAGVSSGDLVVEIGPGHGTMTRIIAGRAGRLIAIEFDKRLFDNLAREFSASRNVGLVNMDVMDYDFGALPPFKVIANIPYYITTPIIFRLIEDAPGLVSMTLTIQKEVAERIVAGPGGRDYGILSLMVQFFGKAGLVFTIPAGAFTPRPKVDSAVIRIVRHEKSPVDLVDPTVFRKVIRASFAGRRKMIGNTLKPFNAGIRSLLEGISIDPKRRPETLSMEEFAEIANALAPLL